MPVKTGKVNRKEKTGNHRCASKQVITLQSQGLLSLRRSGCISELHRGGENKMGFFMHQPSRRHWLWDAPRKVFVLRHFSHTVALAVKCRRTQLRMWKAAIRMAWGDLSGAPTVIVSHFKILQNRTHGNGKQ